MTKISPGALERASAVEAAEMPALQRAPARTVIPMREQQRAARPLKIVILGLSITSSWGNGHATTYRGLVKGLNGRGHEVLFLERDEEWYASNRDMPKPPYGRTELYKDFDELKRQHRESIRNADVVVVGSYVADGVAIGDWVTRTARGVTAFYDIDTPVTLARLKCGDMGYLTRDLVRRYHLYLSFTGGPILDRLMDEFGSPMARALYCSVDPELYYPEPRVCTWDLGYMGTYSEDRQPALERLLGTPARRWTEGRFVVAGPQYPESIRWPVNVQRFIHLDPSKHRAFYNAQRFTLNITRAHMVAAGHSPSVRLFEAAACGTPIISDPWAGLETVLKPGVEILLANSPEEMLAHLRDLDETSRRQIGLRARARVLSGHTGSHRAAELEDYVEALLKPTEKTARD